MPAARTGTRMRSLEAEHYLLDVILRRDKVPSFERYPFSLPAVRNLHTLELHPKITFIVGENGSGKSTLVEAIAIAWGFNPEGGSKNFKFDTWNSHSELHECLRLAKSPRRARDGFFLRAESFFNVATEIERLDKFDPELRNAPPPLINAYGGKSLHKQSHGESFFALLMNRFRGHGFYVLDEPEAALSPSRQLVMLTRLHDLAKQQSQFVIATHSPLLMAYPDAWIYRIGEGGLERVEYQDTPHYQVTRAFLTDTERQLAELLD